ncbi:alpha/beta-hydrolase, partial [Dendrothele bispora CBS 962.96]
MFSRVIFTVFRFLLSYLLSSWPFNTQTWKVHGQDVQLRLSKLIESEPVFETENFASLESLSVLSHSYFTKMNHDSFPSYGVRIKKTRFCDTTVNTYTGYIDIQPVRHLFFYFFESRSSPQKDDIIIWLNGGPGCSSALGLFFELGPCSIIYNGSETTTEFNPLSWNTNANIFFIDQPVGSGFSYSEGQPVVSTTEETAQDLFAFLAIFFAHATEFQGRRLHLAGESYAGRLIPVMASTIYDRNPELEMIGMEKINLASIMMGDGLTDWLTMLPSYYDMACTPASVPPVLPIQTCIRMKSVIPRCEKWLQETCIDVFDSIACGAAIQFCADEIGLPFNSTGLNAWDMSRKCEGGPGDNCYPETRRITEFLSKPSVQSILGVDPAVSSFSFCNDDIVSVFFRTQDRAHPSVLHVAALLERGIRVLVYVGEYDWLCNWVGQERWVHRMEWSGRDEFVRKEMEQWNVEIDGERRKSGRIKSANGLTFLVVDKAGHMMPYDKPKEALYLLQGWISKESL